MVGGSRVLAIPVMSSTGSRRAELLEEAKQVIGDTPLYIAAEHHPIDAWRVYLSRHPEHYMKDSEVCNALKTLSLQLLILVKLYPIFLCGTLYCS